MDSLKQKLFNDLLKQKKVIDMVFMDKNLLLAKYIVNIIHLRTFSITLYNKIKKKKKSPI